MSMMLNKNKWLIDTVDNIQKTREKIETLTRHEKNLEDDIEKFLIANPEFRSVYELISGKKK